MAPNILKYLVVFFLLVSCIALVQATLPANITTHSNVQLYLPGNESTVTDQPLTSKGIQTFGTVARNTTDAKFGAASLDFSATGEINATTISDWEYTWKVNSVSNYSTSMWIQQLTPNALYVIQDLGGGTSGANNATTWFVNANKAIFGLGNDTAGGQYVANFTYSDTLPVLGSTWHYYTLTVDWTKNPPVKMYMDGSLVAAWNNTGKPPSTGPVSTNPFRLVSWNLGVYTQQKVDDVVMWNGKVIDATIVPTREFLTNPTAAFSHNYTSGAPFTVGFTDGTLGNTPTVYNYYFTNTTPGNNTEILFGTSANPSQVFGPGNFIITEQVTNTFGTSNASAWLNVTVVSVPSATFTSVNITPVTNSTSYGWEGVAPFTMQFTSTSSGAPTSYVWNYTKLGSTTPVTFNQSAFSSPIYTFASSGNYTIQLNATNIYGSNQSIQTTWVNITTPAPTSYFIANVSSGPTPLPVLFTDLSPGYPDTWNWSVDEGTGLQWFNLTNPLSHDLTYTFVPVRSSRVNLTVANISTMSDYSTSSMNITVTNQPPVASFVKNNTYGTTGTVFQFNDTSTGNNIYGWNWSFGDGNVSSSRNVTHQFPLGTYNVNLTVTNDGGSSTSIQTVYVSAFTSSYTANSTLGVVPMAVLFTETSTGLLPDSYYWEFGDGGTDTVQNPTHVYNTIGIFSVAHRITNGTSVSWVNTSNMIKTEIANISASFTVSNSSTATAPLVVRFTDTSTLVNATPATYYWVLGDGSTSTDKNPLHLYTNFGVYYANLTVRNGSTSNTSTLTSLSVASPYPNNASFNFVLNQNYPATIRIKDAVTLALINNVTVTESDGTATLVTNGLFSKNFGYGSHTFKFEATGYNTVTTSIFIIYNSTYTVTLTPSAVSTHNVIYQPTQIEFVLSTASGLPLSGAHISATPLNFTAPDGWTNTLLGIDSSVNIVDTTVSGYTGTDGTWSAPMLASQQYMINISGTQSGAPYSYSITLYPAVSPVILTIPIGVVQIPTSATNIITYSINNISVNSTAQNIALNYVDTSSSTTTLIFWVRNATGAIVKSETYTSTAANSQSVNWSILVVRGQSYTYGFSANTSNFQDPWINQTATFDIGTQFGLLGQNPGEAELWIAIILLLLFGAIGSIYFKHVVLIGIPILYWFLATYPGWLPLSATIYVLLGVMLTLGILIYVRYKENMLT